MTAIHDCFIRQLTAALATWTRTAQPQASKHSRMDRRGASKFHFHCRSYWQLVAIEEERVTNLWGRGSSARRWPHIYLHMGITN